MTLDNPIRFRTAVKALMLEDYMSSGSFHHTGDIWGTSSGTVHRMITNDHWPTSRKIQKALREKAVERGIEIVSRVRVDLDTGIGKDELQAIREMTIEQRTEILIRGIDV